MRIDVLVIHDCLALQVDDERDTGQPAERGAMDAISTEAVDIDDVG